MQKLRRLFRVEIGPKDMCAVAIIKTPDGRQLKAIMVLPAASVTLVEKLVVDVVFWVDGSNNFLLFPEVCRLLISSRRQGGLLTRYGHYRVLK